MKLSGKTNPKPAPAPAGEFSAAAATGATTATAIAAGQTSGASEKKPASLDLAAIREKLQGVRGQHYWRSLDEVAETEEFREMLQREFPEGASEWLEGLSRRSFLKLAAASLALAGLSACTKQPVHAILPYVKQPENLVLGQPLYYATAMALGGYATGVLAKSREGHPIKVDGNPEHPASGGGSSIWMQASILDLYDPDRSQAIIANGDNSSWAAFQVQLDQLIRRHEADQGAGLCFLTETVTSPTLTAQLDDLLKRFPKAQVHSYDPVARDPVRAGARLAFGEVVETHYRFDQAAVIVSLDADFLYTHPQRLRYTRDFTDGRRVSGAAQTMNRLYVVESTPSVTGAMADHRAPLASGDVLAFARELAERVGAVAANPSAASGERIDWMAALVHDLAAHHGNSIIIAGEWQPPEVHALAHLLNEHLGNVGNTVFYTAPADPFPVQQINSLRQLTTGMKAGAVETLFILGGNPAYSAPADFEFETSLAKVKCSIHLGLHFDETAAACTWHLPQAHYLESWGDARAFDGTITLLQPLIAPLYEGKSAGEILEALANPSSSRSDYEILHDHWKAQNRGGDFERDWRRSICAGLIANSAFPEKRVALRTDAISAASSRDAIPKLTRENSPLELNFRPDPCLWDGSFANNGWLQECAKPISKLTWGNAVLVSPALAHREKLMPGDVVELSFAGRVLSGPVWIMPGQAENSLTVHLGQGRQRVGRVGAGVGFNATMLRTGDAFWRAAEVGLKKLNQQQQLVSTQTHQNLHSPDRQVHREGTWREFRSDPEFVKKTVESPAVNDTLYNPGEFKYDGYKWAMSIDLNTCIGCNACLVACAVENNIPIVGKAQVKANRELYWIRIDTYFKGPLENPEFAHMPVPCMHCEHAPCELVCPVAATVHDHEGLNLMIYNRCVGTRFCSNNCPYKVRRFNFLRYADYQTPSLEPRYNPEVTVRWRGVMEKCSYCVQHIAAARITAEQENRSIRDGEVRPACQVACPAQAIVFGDLNLKDSRVAKLKQHPLDYAMLGELNTRPRTTYLAKLRNPNTETKAAAPETATAVVNPS